MSTPAVPLRPRVAVVPAAGRGRRLDQIETPKPLVEVGGTALIVRLLEQLEAAGVERAVVVVGHRGDEIQRALFRHPGLSINLELVDNPRWERGMVESILCARDHVDEPFLLAMADHVFTGDTAARVRGAPLAEEDVVCVLGDAGAGSHDLQSPVRMAVDGDRVLDAGRCLADGSVVDAGLFVARPALFDTLEQAARRGCTDLCEAVRMLAAERRVRWLDVGDAPWFDVDTPSELILAEMALRHRSRAPTAAAVGPAPAPPADAYAFSTGRPARTEIVIQRGFVRRPDALSFIPARSASSPIYVFTDPRVNALYGDDFVGGMQRAGYDVRRIVLPEGEAAKTLENYARLADRILAEGIDEHSILVSLGGGAVCNVCGFLASTLYRGVGLVHVPTTVMAQCDAAISHKQAVNGSRGKNLVGSYYPPLRIVVDIDVLATLDAWLVPDGLAEVIKHALAQDPDLLELLLAYDGDMRDPDFLERVIRRNIELKCLLVSQDPKELREALVLHYGHTVGHAVEYLSSYGLGHGQSVAIGMMVAARVARIMGCCGEDVVEIHREVLEKFDLPTRIPAEIEVDAIIEMMRYDKRYLVEGTRIPLVGRPGRLHQVAGEFAVPVPHQLLAEALRGSY